MRRFLAFLLLLGVSAGGLRAAIAYDATTSEETTNTNDHTWSHPLGTASGTNRILIVTLTTEDVTSVDQVVSSITAGGVAMTAVSDSGITNGNNRVECYYMLDASLRATSGAVSINVTFAGTVGNLLLGSISLTGVNQAAPEAVAIGSASSASSLSTNITTTSANAWLISSINLGDDRSFTAGGSATERYEHAIDTVTSSALSTTATTTAGTTAVSWTIPSSANRLVQAVVAVAPANITLSGNVFEDVTYTGGVGRTKATSSGVNCASARVELFNASGTYVSATTTDASGNYSFSVPPSVNYTIRVVNSTVTSSLGGTSLIPVQTYRTTATTGSAVNVTDRVGGENPAYADAGNGSTTLAALSSGSVTPQSITSVTASTSNITGLNFGFNFNTIVNTTDTGQGSLRQFITNANGMSGTQTSVFMISDGSAHSGLRTGLTNQLTSGVAVITLATLLPPITGTLTLDGTSQTTNVGNTNSGTLGTGGTVGVDALALSTVNRPEVEIVGTSAMATGLDINAASTTVQGIAIHGHGSGASSNQGDIYVRATSVAITACVVGSTATSFSLPGANATSASGIIAHTNATNGSLTNSLVGFTGIAGVRFGASPCTGWTVSGIEVRGTCVNTPTSEAFSVRDSGHTISGNLIVANKSTGLEITNTITSLSVINNTVSGNGVGTGGGTRTAGVRITTSVTGTSFDRNIITANYGPGVSVTNAYTGGRFTRNSIYSNGTITNDASAAATGQIGIDLLSASDNVAAGTAPFYTLNDSGDGDSGGNTLLNTPVIDTATIVGSNLVLTGWVSAGSTVEFFISDGAASGFGEGQTYIGSVVEGSGSDTDATTSSYSGNVNCFAQGADTNVARFSYTFAKPGSVSVGTVLTATATNASNNTSEFSGNTAVVSNFPSYTAVKSSETISDPVNATTNPKSIPGGVAQYSVTVTNSNPAYADADSFVVTDPIPTNTELYVGDIAGGGSGPVQFVDGATTSALTYTYTSLANMADDVSFSNNSGSTWTYVPTPDGNGCDSAVTNLRINPKGTFAKAACGNNPSCTLRFRVRVK